MGWKYHYCQVYLIEPKPMAGIGKSENMQERRNRKLNFCLDIQQKCSNFANEIQNVAVDAEMYRGKLMWKYKFSNVGSLVQSRSRNVYHFVQMTVI